MQEWDDGEKADYMCWCLHGKASEYYALVNEKNELNYKSLIKKFEAFGFKSKGIA